MKFFVSLLTGSTVLLMLAARALLASDLDQPQRFVAKRSSSCAVDGSNADAARVPARSRHTVADIQGAGRIVHMWFTVGTAEPNYLKTTRLKIFWDGQKMPAVDVPFGDFHALGFGIVRQVSSAFVTVEARPELNLNRADRNVAGFNSYFPMPYGKGARVVIENTSDQPLDALYYQIDYQQWKEVPSPFRFHAAWRETPAEPFPGSETGRRDARNPDGRDNHVILETRGRGHLAGVVLSVDAAGAGWWEGDEMIWVDGEARPSIHGTGAEDYFGGAWGFRREYNMPYHGLSFLEKPYGLMYLETAPGRKDWQAGKYTVYRFHERDPIPFTRSFKMSIEGGHNNHRRDSVYTSVAHWYQE